jgi:hypothetical protein
MELYYNSNIQTSKEICQEIYNNSIDKKMLVFGLGYDSQLWYNATNFNTFFVEDDLTWINMNTEIDNENIIHYQYNSINVKNSYDLSDEFISTFKPPKKLLDEGPFDVIFIDGPRGYSNELPGRLLPIYWSKEFLSKSGTVVYIDDANRKLENYCINKYFSENKKEFLNYRDGCYKVYL